MALLRERAALSELPLVHPTLPFAGIIDLIWSDSGEAVIADFKTGQEKPAHQRQVAYYAVLCWRCRGDIPGRAEVRYPDRFVPVSINEALLVEAEEELRRRVSAATTTLGCIPTQVVLGQHCRHGDVRQFCDRYWADRNEMLLGQTSTAGQEKSLDIEVTVVGEPSSSGFDAQGGETDIFPVIYREEVALVHGPFMKGEQRRIPGNQMIEGARSN